MRVRVTDQMAIPQAVTLRPGFPRVHAGGECPAGVSAAKVPEDTIAGTAGTLPPRIRPLVGMSHHTKLLHERPAPSRISKDSPCVRINECGRRPRCGEAREAITPRGSGGDGIPGIDRSRRGGHSRLRGGPPSTECQSFDQCLIPHFLACVVRHGVSRPAVGGFVPGQQTRVRTPASFGAGSRLPSRGFRIRPFRTSGGRSRGSDRRTFACSRGSSIPSPWPVRRSR